MKCRVRGREIQDTSETLARGARGAPSGHDGSKFGSSGACKPDGRGPPRSTVWPITRLPYPRPGCFPV